MTIRNILVLLALTACAKKADTVDHAVSGPLPDDTEWRNTIVDFDPSLVENCGIATTLTYFKYDSAALSDNGKDVVSDIAECVTTGPLKGAELVVVGSTDASGEDMYNMKLGMSRARSVEMELAKGGVAKTRVTTVSLGEFKASASPQTWPADRQVRVEVAPGTVAIQSTADDVKEEPAKE